MKSCEVCGGHVRPVDGQVTFGYCENCGLVYALKVRLVERKTPEFPEGPSGGPGTKSAERERRATSGPDTEDQVSSVVRWRCSDCGTALQADEESDLEFLKREHIREYHPNRSNG